MTPHEKRIKEIAGKLKKLLSTKEKLSYLNEVRSEIKQESFIKQGGLGGTFKNAFDPVLMYVDSEIQNLPSEKQDKPTLSNNKIKWNGTPSQFGYLFLELVKHGFIEPPPHGSEWSYSGLAKQCYQYFHIESKPGKLTTLENLIKELQPDNIKTGNRKNTLCDSIRAKFTIPDLPDLA